MTRPRGWARSEVDTWWRIARVGMGSMLRVGLDIRIEGARNLPASGGALLTPNHMSVLDPLVVSLACVDRKRAPHFIVLSEIAGRPILGWGLRRLRQVPIKRGLGDWRAIEDAARVIRSGCIAALFPEGTMGNGSELLPGRKGAARIALATGAPVVPIGIWGTQERWPREGIRVGRPLRSRVGVVFGPPIQPEGDPRSRGDVRALTDRVMTAIGEARAEARELARR
jgi:1-acyl-sn-glycerol-3-phosphate acyltransferase